LSSITEARGEEHELLKKNKTSNHFFPKIKTSLGESDKISMATAKSKFMNQAKGAAN